jgi:hypothetical protein
MLEIRQAADSLSGSGQQTLAEAGMLIWWSDHVRIMGSDFLDAWGNGCDVQSSATPICLKPTSTFGIFRITTAHEIEAKKQTKEEENREQQKRQ